MSRTQRPRVLSYGYSYPSGLDRDLGHGDLLTEYINRMLDSYSHSAGRQHRNRRSVSSRAPVASPEAEYTPQAQYSAHHHKRKHKYHRQHKMTAFSGPWSHDLDGLEKSERTMPDGYKASFSSASTEVLEKVCDPDALHIWESDSDIDNLLQLTSVIAKLCNLGTRKEKGANASDGSMIIIAKEKSGRSNFGRICDLVQHLTCASATKHFHGAIVVFSKIVVVKGWDDSVRSDRVDGEVERAIKRINTTIERVFKMSTFSSGKKKLVWHHGPVVHFLLTWINNTTSILRSSLHAITITGSLDLTDSVKPSPSGRSNTLEDLTCLETYAKNLSIPVVFLDPSSQLITSSHLTTYMYYHGYYIHTFLPRNLTQPHLYAAQDALVTFCFRILGASKAQYESSMVDAVKARLPANMAKQWARTCVSKSSYSKAKCRSAGSDTAIHNAVQLAESPFAPFSCGDEAANANGKGIPGFSRLAVGPAAHSSMHFHTALPVDVSFSKQRMRPAHPSAFFILVPCRSHHKPGTTTSDEKKVTPHIQGTMMAVLERVRQEKGNPVLAAEDKAMWSAVRKACTWALDESGKAMPREIKGKVKFVGERLARGTWSLATGSHGGGNDTERAQGHGENTISEAAHANHQAAAAAAAVAAARPYGSSPATATPFAHANAYPVQHQHGHFAPNHQPRIPYTSPFLHPPPPPPSPHHNHNHHNHHQAHIPGYRPVRIVDPPLTQSPRGNAGFGRPPPPIRQPGRGQPQSAMDNWI
ncbi:hypothetical protein ACEQ8H_007914 [Pleosporales sp. CAS-2024a]